MLKKKNWVTGPKNFPPDVRTIYSYRIELKLHEPVRLINISIIYFYFLRFSLPHPPVGLLIKSNLILMVCGKFPTDKFPP